MLRAIRLPVALPLLLSLLVLPTTATPPPLSRQVAILRSFRPATAPIEAVRRAKTTAVISIPVDCVAVCQPFESSRETCTDDSCFCTVENVSTFAACLNCFPSYVAAFPQFGSGNAAPETVFNAFLNGCTNEGFLSPATLSSSAASSTASSGSSTASTNATTTGAVSGSRSSTPTFSGASASHTGWLSVTGSLNSTSLSAGSSTTTDSAIHNSFTEPSSISVAYCSGTTACPSITTSPIGGSSGGQATQTGGAGGNPSATHTGGAVAKVAGGRDGPASTAAAVAALAMAVVAGAGWLAVV